MLLPALAGALASLLVLAIVLALVLKRSPRLFVADTLPDRVYDGPDDLSDLVEGRPEGESSRQRERFDAADFPDPEDVPDPAEQLDDGDLDLSDLDLGGEGDGEEGPFGEDAGEPGTDEDGRSGEPGTDEDGRSGD